MYAVIVQSHTRVFYGPSVEIQLSGSIKGRNYRANNQRGKKDEISCIFISFHKNRFKIFFTFPSSSSWLTDAQMMTTRNVNTPNDNRHARWSSKKRQMNQRMNHLLLIPTCKSIEESVNPHDLCSFSIKLLVHGLVPRFQLFLASSCDKIQLRKV